MSVCERAKERPSERDRERASPRPTRANHHPPAHARVAAFGLSAWAKERSQGTRRWRLWLNPPASTHEFDPPLTSSVTEFLLKELTRHVSSAVALVKPPPSLAFDIDPSQEDDRATRQALWLWSNIPPPLALAALYLACLTEYRHQAVLVAFERCSVPSHAQYRASLGIEHARYRAFSVPCHVGGSVSSILGVEPCPRLGFERARYQACPLPSRAHGWHHDTKRASMWSVLIIKPY